LIVPKDRYTKPLWEKLEEGNMVDVWRQRNKEQESV